MDVKDYLRDISKRGYEIQKMKESLVKLKSMASGGASPKMDGLPHGSRATGSSLENFVCKAIDLEKQIQEKESELEKDKHTICEVLDTLSGSEPKRLICMRYFEHCSWKQISETLGCSLGWVYRIHGEVLDQLRLKMKVVA